MTKSKLKIKGLLLLTFIILLTSVTLIWLVPKMDLSDTDFIGYYFFLFMLFGFTGTIYILLRDTKKIEIDDNEIRYRNWLTSVKTKYKLDELDGFTITQEITNGGLVRTIYLVNDGKMIGKISEFFYDNFDELLTGIQKAKFLGPFNWSILKSIKIFLGQRIKLS